MIVLNKDSDCSVKANEYHHIRPFLGQKGSMLHKVLPNECHQCMNGILDVEDSIPTDTQDTPLSVGIAIFRDALVSRRNYFTHKEDPKSIDRSSTTARYYFSACKTASIHYG